MSIEFKMKLLENAASATTKHAKQRERTPCCGISMPQWRVQPTHVVDFLYFVATVTVQSEQTHLSSRNRPRVGNEADDGSRELAFKQFASSTERNDCGTMNEKRARELARARERWKCRSSPNPVKSRKGRGTSIHRAKL